MSDERMHAVGADPAWSESYYFNFVDPDSKIGMFTRMGFRPGNGWADALHVVYLPGRRVAFTYGRREIDADLTRYDDDLKAGGLTLACIEPHQLWSIEYRGPAQDIPNPDILLERRKSRPDGWYTPATLEMELSFDCLTSPHFAAAGERGHFEQSGHVKGHIDLGGEHWQVDGYGVRDKSWGPRDWGAGNGQDMPKISQPSEGPTPFVNWFSMNFGQSAALGGSCFRHSDGVMRGEGWLQRDGESIALKNVIIETDYAVDSILHRSIRFNAETGDGETINISGEVLNVCPTKIAMPGGATFVNEGLVELRWEGRSGYGIAEHWHAVKL
jgi:hypothetical protein